MALELDQLKWLNDPQKERYMFLQRFFESDYWDFFKSWATHGLQEADNRLLNAQQWDHNRLAMGARLAFMSMLNLEASTDAEFSQYAAEAAESVKQEDEVENQA
jgi:hypothetical protein